MSDFVRVKDKTTGHEFSVRHPNLARVEVLDEPAVDNEGRSLPAKPAAPTVSPETSDAVAVTEKSKSPTPGAESAKKPKEGSA